MDRIDLYMDETAMLIVHYISESGFFRKYRSVTLSELETQFGLIPRDDFIDYLRRYESYIFLEVILNTGIEITIVDHLNGTIEFKETQLYKTTVPKIMF